MSMFQISKPYPNYHAARIKNPGSFIRIRVLQTTKTGIMLYGGPLKSNPKAAVLQAVRFPKDKYTVAQAKKWLKDHKQSYILFEPASSKKKSLWSKLLNYYG